MIEFIWFLFILDFASDDVNKNLQAYFNCPKKWRKAKKRIIRIEKHSLSNNNEDYNNEK
jgi:hypothetical protein